MSELLRDTALLVNLTAIKENIIKIKNMYSNDVDIMAVVKADGYGHGAVKIAQTIMEAGASYLAVATLSEALALRKEYSEYPIFILGHTPDRLLKIAIENNITLTIFSLTQAKLLNDICGDMEIKAKVHIKVDTGFHRLGSSDKNELLLICALPYIETEGIFSHLALVNDQENLKQYNLFLEFISFLESKGISFRYKHISDSISAVDYPQYALNMIRPGALLYGLKGFHKGNLDVVQALQFVSRLSQVRNISKGEGVGYDFLWKAPKDTLIGTLPFGYADGYPRNMKDKGYVTIAGKKCPIIGVICMDQCMVDLSNVPDAKEGTTAIIYGDGSNNTMSIDEAAKLAATNKNEIVSRISARPPRIYIY